MATDFEPFRKLAPERRMRELQNLIEELRKEIDERQNDIREAEHLLTLADSEARVLEQIEVPATKPLRVRREGIEEKAEEKPERLTREERLELEQLLSTAPRSEQLIHNIAHRPVSELYSELHKIYSRQQQTGLESQRDRDAIYAIRKGLEVKGEDMREGEYSADKQAKHLLTAAQQMAEGMYQSGAGTYKRSPA